MDSRYGLFGMAVGLLLAGATPHYAQELHAIPAISFDTGGPVIRAHAEALKPFTVAGERGALLGQQNGTLEAWVLPVKLLSHLTIEAQVEGGAAVEGHGGPIDMSAEAAEVEVRPDRTTITYADPSFTVRQIMFSPDEAAQSTGPVVLFEFDCVHPTSFTFRFTPELRWMWPEPNAGTTADWVTGAGGAYGYYVLRGGDAGLGGAVAIPGAQAVTAAAGAAPSRAVELRLTIDPARDRGRLFPLLMAVGSTPATATREALGSTLASLDEGIAAGYHAHAERYRKLLATATRIETPDKALNEAFEWAVVSMEQLRARAYKTDELGLVAGYDSAGDSERPGFGWFFGRDSLYSIYAIDGYGDFSLAKAELEFLIRRQSAAGKIMHEYAQTAPLVDWQATPYEYAAADSTPLFLLAVEEYVRSSGDVGFLTANRAAIEKAWAFETDPAHDTDHDGIYDNSQGTGWVENWPGAMPHQEIYLALLDQQASAAMAKIEKQLGDTERATAAERRAAQVAATIEREYYDKEKGCYAFSHNMDGTQDRTTNVYASLAWWDPDGKPVLAHGDECLRQMAGHTLNTDWGLRDISNEEKIYDGTSYHYGSVWPLFTGWAALAEYRGGQPLAGYQLLMENANLTWAQDLGADTEWLSGDFYTPMPSSTSHQLWSSAMVITPTLRGLFGISIDAQAKTITVNPHLPAGWDHAEVDNLRLPDGAVSLYFQRTNGSLEVSVLPGRHAPEVWKLRTDLPDAILEHQSGGPLVVKISEPKLEVADYAIREPAPGQRTRQPRVISEVSAEGRISLTVEGLAGSKTEYWVRQPDRVMPRIDVSNGLSSNADAEHAGVSLSFADSWELSHGAPLSMYFFFPPGEGWKTITVTLTW